MKTLFPFLFLSLFILLCSCESRDLELLRKKNIHEVSSYHTQLLQSITQFQEDSITQAQLEKELTKIAHTFVSRENVLQTNLAVYYKGPMKRPFILEVGEFEMEEMAATDRKKYQHKSITFEAIHGLMYEKGSKVFFRKGSLIYGKKLTPLWVPIERIETSTLIEFER